MNETATPPPTALACPRCGKPLSTLGNAASCPRCRVEFQMRTFPALERPLAPAHRNEAIVGGEEAGCFYHPEKRAVVPCDSCGRFLCALCDLDVAGSHLCPACLEKGRTTHALGHVDTYRTSYPDIALVLALLPLVMWPITLVTAPVALWFSIRGWKKPPSLTGNRKRFRLVLATIVSVLQIVGWGILAVAAFNGFFKAF